MVHAISPSCEPGPLKSQLRFTLKQWCLWQSQQMTPATTWPNGVVLPYDAGSANVGFLPMMQRRRLSPLARAACAVAWHSRQICGDMPTVFFSNHGESQYYFEILSDLAAGEGVSPSRFSLCVHNAIGGLHSLHSENFQPYVSLAGGSEGFFTPFIEAAGLLLEAPAVLAVWYEQPLPEAYQAYVPLTENTWALAMVLTKVDEPGPHLDLVREATVNQSIPECQETNLLQAILNNRHSGSSRLERCVWHWNLINA